MKKKIVCLLLTCVMCLSLTPPTAFALGTQSNACYIASPDCPEGYLEYASETISKFVLSLDDDFDELNLSVGTPFAFADYEPDVYYFPIVCNGIIRYLFRVYPDGDTFSAVISRFLADDIESLAYLTSAETPMYLNRVDTKIFATIGGNSYELYQYSDDMSDGQNLTISSLKPTYPAKDVKTFSGIELNLHQPRYSSVNIPLNITETQGSNDWCTAYCLATIIRTKTSFNANAKGLMTLALGDSFSTSSRFPWVSDSGTTMRRVLSQYGLSPVVLTTTVSREVLIQEIAAYRPCLAAMTATCGTHSIVLRGWNSSGIWSIWNPWFNFYESYSMEGVYVPTGYSASTHSFSQYMHVYNFG